MAGPAAKLELGPRWRPEIEAWRSADTVEGRLRVPEPFVDELDAWFVHPAIVDVATSFGIALGKHDDQLHVPVGYESVTRWLPMPEDPWVRATRRNSSDELLTVDLDVGDERGVVLRIGGLTLRPLIQAEALAQPPADEPVAEQEVAHHHVAPVVALAERHGIRAARGPRTRRAARRQRPTAPHRLEHRARRPPRRRRTCSAIRRPGPRCLRRQRWGAEVGARHDHGDLGRSPRRR